VMQSILYVEPEGHAKLSGVCPHVWVDGLSITGE
jgi:PmbA protein